MGSRTSTSSCATGACSGRLRSRLHAVVSATRRTVTCRAVVPLPYRRCTHQVVTSRVCNGGQGRSVWQHRAVGLVPHQHQRLEQQQARLAHRSLFVAASLQGHMHQRCRDVLLWRSCRECFDREAAHAPWRSGRPLPGCPPQSSDGRDRRMQAYPVACGSPARRGRQHPSYRGRARHSPAPKLLQAHSAGQVQASREVGGSHACRVRHPVSQPVAQRGEGLGSHRRRLVSAAGQQDRHHRRARGHQQLLHGGSGGCWGGSRHRMTLCRGVRVLGCHPPVPWGGW